MGKSISKIRHIQEMNAKIENNFLNENKKTINEGWWDRVVANAKGFAERFRVIGSNMGGMIKQDPAFESAKVRIDNRADRLFNELDGFQKDMQALFDRSDKKKVQRRLDKAERKADSEIERNLVQGEKDTLFEFRNDIQQLIANAETIKTFLQNFTHKY